MLPIARPIFLTVIFFFLLFPFLPWGIVLWWDNRVSFTSIFSDWVPLVVARYRGEVKGFVPPWRRRGADSGPSSLDCVLWFVICYTRSTLLGLSATLLFLSFVPMGWFAFLLIFLLLPRFLRLVLGPLERLSNTRAKRFGWVKPEFAGQFKKLDILLAKEANIKAGIYENEEDRVNDLASLFIEKSNLVAALEGAELVE